MSTEITQEDKKFIDDFVYEFKQMFITTAEFTNAKFEDYLSKMSSSDIARLGKVFKLYGRAGLIPAIKESLDGGSADPLFKYVLSTIVIAIAIPTTLKILPALAATLIIGAVADKVYDIVQDLGETIGENEIKKINDLQEKIFDWSTKIDEIIDDDFNYSNAEVIVEDKNIGNIVRITDGVKNYIFDDDYNSSITGSAIDDIVYLGNGRNVINSGAGNDTIYGGDGVDVVHGGADDDRIITGKGNDIIFGGTGVNYIEPGEGNNEIHCDPNGEDHIYISNVLEIKNTYLEKRL